MAGQDPHAIQREIEQTRAELADTIDAIADRVSPKRVASRSAARLRTAVQDVLHGGPDGVVASGPGERRALPPSRSGVPLEELRELAAEGSGAAFTGAHTYTVERRLRTDRVLLAVGAVAAAAALAVYLSRSHDRGGHRYIRK